MRLALRQRTGFSATLGATKRSVASGLRRRERTERSCCAGDGDGVVAAVTREASAASVVLPTSPLSCLGRSAGGRKSLYTYVGHCGGEERLCNKTGRNGGGGERERGGEIGGELQVRAAMKRIVCQECLFFVFHIYTHTLFSFPRLSLSSLALPWLLGGCPSKTRLPPWVSAIVCRRVCLFLSQRSVCVSLSLSESVCVGDRCVRSVRALVRLAGLLKEGK